MPEPVSLPNPGLPPVDPLRQAQSQEIRRQAQAAAAAAFEQVLQTAVEKGETLRFSAHARERLASRGIRLEEGDLSRISQALAKAAAKGARNALLLKDDLALIVSVTNRTVITALDGASMKENVFTNIDSAVVI